MAKSLKSFAPPIKGKRMPFGKWGGFSRADFVLGWPIENGKSNGNPKKKREGGIKSKQN